MVQKPEIKFLADNDGSILGHCQLLRPREVADLLGVSTSKIYRLFQRAFDPLPAVRIGGSTRVRASALDEWISRAEGIGANKRPAGGGPRYGDRLDDELLRSRPGLSSR